MPLTLKSPIPEPEFILCMGVQGTGKSKNILDIARMVPDVKVRVLDIDFRPGLSRIQRLEYPDVTNVIIEKIDPENFDEQVEGIEWLIKETEPDDWCSIDSTTHTWSAVQSWFSDKVHGEDIDDYFLEVRIAKEKAKQAGGDKKSLGAFQGWLDWPVINKRFYRKIYRNIARIDGHIYLTAEQTSVSDDDDKQVRGLYGPYGVKPAGQKRIGFVPETVIMLNKSRVGEYAMTTIKDRGRPEMEDVEVSDFAKDYLIKVAGWQRKPVR